MAYIYYEYRLYKRITDSNWSSNYTLLKGFDPNVRTGLDTKVDVFSFKLLNSFNQYFSGVSVIENGDRILLYAKVNSMTVEPEDILIDGIVMSVKETIGQGGEIFIEGKSRTETLFKGLTFLSSTIPKDNNEIMQMIVSYYNSKNENMQIMWDTNNPEVKTNGDAFPTYQINAFDEPVYKILEQYSSSQFTKDVPYYYYLTYDNYFKWLPKSQTVSDTLDETECNSIDIQDKQDEIINYVKLYCGPDCYGIGINVSYEDAGSIGKYGARGKSITSTNSISTTLMQNEMNRNSASFEAGGDMFPISYPYTTEFGVTATNDRTYNQAIILQAKELGREYGRSIVEKTKNTQKEATATLPFTRRFVQGELLSCNIPSYNYNNTLRITDIQYNSNSIVLTLKEDTQY